MGTRDPRFDTYIAKAPAFAQPILMYVRECVHAACPDVVETMKWSSPFFDYHGPIAGVAAFKEHVRFGFWKAALLAEDEKPGTVPAMGEGRLTALGDLPPKRTLVRLVKKAAALNAAGVKVARTKSAPRAEAEVPVELAAEFAKKKHAQAKKQFDAFSPSHRRAYIEWIAEAKTDATREKRVAQTLEQLAEGKSRHWKYQRA